MSAILIVGATSAIAVAVARRFAVAGHSLYLVGRDPDRLQAVAADLRVRGAGEVEVAVADATDFDSHRALVDAVWARLSVVDVALIAHGTLPDQAACEASFDVARHSLEVNALGVISVATWLAGRFERQGHGTIAAISSVAADRGRQSNYLYGAGKATVDVFFQGLRNRLHGAGVQVLTIKPGFVDSPMTESFRKGPLWASPEVIARGIESAIARRRDVVYLPWFWAPIMLVIRAIPERLFKRMSL